MDPFAWLRERPVLAAALLYGVLSVALVSPALVPGHTLSGSDVLYTYAPWQDARPADVRELGSNPELFDSAFQYQPWLQYTRESLPHIPTWNPYISGGRPYVGNAQSAVFSPFSLPAYVLPFWWSLGVIAALKVFVSAFGTFLLARSLGARFPGALLSGLVFGFGLWTVIWLSWPHSSVWAIMPWLWLLVDRLVKRPGPLPAAGLALAVGLQFAAGHPESSFHVMMATTAFLGFRLLAERRAEGSDRHGLVRRVALFGAAIVGGTALAALVILPFAELLINSQDLARRDDFGGYTLERRHALGMFLYSYWGQGTGTLLQNFTVERSLYPGALTLTLAAAALLRPTLERVFLAGLGAFCLAMVFGVQPIYDIATALPGFKEARNVRLVAVLLLCFALLAGRGLDDLVERHIDPRRLRILVAASAAILLIPVLYMLVKGLVHPSLLGRSLETAWGFAAPPPASDADAADVIRQSALILWITFALPTVGLVLLSRRRGIGVAAVATCAVALLTLDLFRAGMGQNPALPVERATQPETPGLRYLESRSPARFVGLDEPGPLRHPMPPDVGMRYGLYDSRGYDFPIEKRLAHMWETRVSYPGVPHKVTPTTIALYDAESRRVFDLLGVRSVLQQPSGKPLDDDTLRTAYEGPDARIYDNPRALPKVSLIGSQRVVSGEEAALASVLEPDFDRRRQVVTEEPLPGIPETAVEGGGPGEARLAVYEPERVVARTDGDRRAVLLLNDVHFPGWKAEIDGDPAPIARVDYLLRGVVVPPGAHEVEFRYQPASWRAGWIISLVSLAGLALTVVFGLRRRRVRKP